MAGAAALAGAGALTVDVETRDEAGLAGSVLQAEIASKGTMADSCDQRRAYLAHCRFEKKTRSRAAVPTDKPAFPATMGIKSQIIGAPIQKSIAPTASHDSRTRYALGPHAPCRSEMVRWGTTSPFFLSKRFPLVFLMNFPKMGSTGELSAVTWAPKFQKRNFDKFHDGTLQKLPLLFPGTRLALQSRGRIRDA